MQPSDAIDEIIERAGKVASMELNEAATRLLLIDDILTKVLQWPLEELNPEEYAGGSEQDGTARAWIDYHLKSDGTFRLVVEAKRSGTHFSLTSPKRPRRIPLKQLLRNQGPELRDAIDQAQRYCYRVGTYGFVVTNGIQWVASVAFAHNIHHDKLEATVYYDLEDIRDNLADFIELLSPQGIGSQTLLAAAISGGSITPAFAKRLNAVLPASAAPDKNYLARPLNALMTLCFRDMTDAEHAAMLERCYVPSEAGDPALTRLEPFVGSTLPNKLTAAKTVRRDLGEARVLGNVEPLPGVSLVVGRAGSGKSTFITVTERRLHAKQGDDAFIINVNLISRTQIHSTEFAHDRLIQDISSDLLFAAEQKYAALNPFEHDLLREIFFGEIKRLVSSMSPTARANADLDLRIDELIQKHLADPVHHLKAYLGFLHRRGVSPVLFLDNVDRGTPAFERLVFQLGKRMAENTNACVVTTLRDTTYEEGKLLGFLDVGPHTVYAITAPPFGEVARRRLDYVHQQLVNDQALWRRFSKSLDGASHDQVFDFANILSDLLFSGGKEIQSCIQALATTNIRLALELLEDFTTSPSTDLNRLFTYHQHARRRPESDAGLPIDLFLRSVMKMKAVRYEESGSKIANIFQASDVQMSSHFTAIRVLQFLRWQASRARQTKDRSVDDVIRELGALGYGAASTAEALDHRNRTAMDVVTA